MDRPTGASEDMAENRRWPRFLFSDLEIELQAESRLSKWMPRFDYVGLVDISAAGLGLLAEKSYVEGTGVTVWFQRSAEESYSLRAVVVHCRATRSNPPWKFHLGLEFLYLREKRIVDHPVAARYLRDLIATLERQRDEFYSGDSIAESD